jgi:hypothetical protein
LRDAGGIERLTAKLKGEKAKLRREEKRKDAGGIERKVTRRCAER